MATLPLYTIEGNVSGSVAVPDTVFGVLAHPDLLYQAVTAALANRRIPYAHTKDRAQVRGGGRKPWRQKGTGQARHGSRRSPIWVGGGVTFGPTKERVFTKKINKKMRRKALFGVLSAKTASDNIAVIEDLHFPEQKTKMGLKLLRGLWESGSMVIWGSTQDKGFKRVFRNIPNVTPRSIENINILDALNHAHAVFSRSALDSFIQHYADTGSIQEKETTAKRASRATGRKTA